MSAIFRESGLLDLMFASLCIESATYYANSLLTASHKQKALRSSPSREWILFFCSCHRRELYTSPSRVRAVRLANALSFLHHISLLVILFSLVHVCLLGACALCPPRSHVTQHRLQHAAGQRPQSGGGPAREHHAAAARVSRVTLDRSLVVDLWG
jgi:hypothetical protein